MKLLLVISLGGGIGTGLRYLTYLLTNRFASQYFSFFTPVGTLLVNILGSFLIAYLLADNFQNKISPTEFKSIFSIGLLGGFTTMSAFSYEALYIGNHYSFKLALAYVFLMLILSLLFATAGLYLGR